MEQQISNDSNAAPLPLYNPKSRNLIRWERDVARLAEVVEGEWDIVRLDETQQGELWLLGKQGGKMRFCLREGYPLNAPVYHLIFNREIIASLDMDTISNSQVWCPAGGLIAIHFYLLECLAEYKRLFPFSAEEDEADRIEYKGAQDTDLIADPEEQQETQTNLYPQRETGEKATTTSGINTLYDAVKNRKRKPPSRM